MPEFQVGGNMEEGILTKPYIATVLKTDPDERKVAVFIPNLMPTMQAQKAIAYSVPTNSGIALQALTKNVSSTVTKTNYVWVRNWYKNDPMPKEGSKVIVYFIDGNVLLGFWKRFDPNGDFEPIDSERYRKLFDFSVGGFSESVSESDSVSISMPKNFKAVVSDSGKSRTVSISENYGFYIGTDLTEAINDLQKSMEYLSNRETSDMIGSLAAIDFSSVADAQLKTKIASDIETAKTKISDSGNLEEAHDAFSDGFSLAMEEVGLYSTYSSYKNAYNGASSQDRESLDSALGEPYAASIESAFSSLKSYALKASTKKDGDLIKARSESAMSMAPKITYRFYYDSNKTAGAKQEITEGSKSVSALPFSEYAADDLSGYSICHEGLMSSVSVIGWRSSDGIDPAKAVLVYKDMDLSPVLFGLYAREGNSESSIIVDVCNDPGYEYSATMKKGTADPIAISSFPVYVTSGAESVIFEIKHSTDIDLTLTISA